MIFFCPIFPLQMVMTFGRLKCKMGENLQGLIASETPTAILLRNMGGKEISIARQDIRTLTAMSISAMPSGLENNINPQEMADLLAFILKNK
jgi:putative heme-binding domain-containing protein